MAGVILSNNILYVGDYKFSQITAPYLSAARDNGVSKATVKFQGATPIARQFIDRIRRLSLPNIKDTAGALGPYGDPFTLVQLYDGHEVDEGGVWTTVTLSFAIPNSDKATFARESTSSEGLSIQTVRVQGPGESYYEATYYAPTVTHRWTSQSKAGPKDSGPSGNVTIIRAVLHTDPSAPPADLTPEESTRVLDHSSEEVVGSRLWSNTTTVGRILEDDDRSS